MTVAPLAGGVTDAAGTTVVDDFIRADEQRRLPAFLALAQQGHGRYAENLAGMTVPQMKLHAAELLSAGL